MELLLSNYPPANFAGRNTRGVWDTHFQSAHRIKIASGYISSESLIDLKNVIEINKRPRLDLLIGMHYFEGFTKPQYDSAMALNETLELNNLGAIYLSTAAKFHAKLYTFLSKENRCFAALVGSSNLGSIFSPVNRLYEVDCLFSDEQASLVDEVIDRFFNTISVKLSELPPITNFIEKTRLLENHDYVHSISSDKFIEISGISISPAFEIPVKTEPKSNLNAFFGKGRVNGRGFELPRAWYEVELIVPREITTAKGYPRYREFDVVTDDLWSFRCSTHGDYSKNLRSMYDLKILGKWIKGKLENSGALKIGEPVTKEVLEKYGNDKITLRPTRDSDTWLIEFKPNK